MPHTYRGEVMKSYMSTYPPDVGWIVRCRPGTLDRKRKHHPFHMFETEFEARAYARGYDQIYEGYGYMRYPLLVGKDGPEFVSVDHANDLP